MTVRLWAIAAALAATFFLVLEARFVVWIFA